MLVKICGITTPSDGIFVEEAGADLIGINFIESSKRYLPPERAEEVINNIKDKTRIVGLFSDQPKHKILEIVRTYQLSKIQLHGREEIGYIEDLADALPKTVSIIKAFRVSSKESIESIKRFYKALSVKERIFAILLDGPLGGGRASSFNWKEISPYIKEARSLLPRIFLAGGLNICNLEEAISLIEPDGVDVASGVEKEGLVGIKDPYKVKEFIRIAKRY